ncbi:MAG: DUF4493 domain-containing protein [Muribaculaceae bacterium]|nr:DUF4493 domain-containing protein [Muribaculaceae bacterium]
MKFKSLSYILAAASLALAGCDKEATFNMNPGEGQLNCRTLTVDYINNTRANSSDVELGDFIVNFVNTATNDTVRSFKYSEMPEIVSLPQGKYSAKASYGDNPIAEWEAPYYLGDTDFAINVGEITDDVEPVECVLSNIRVRVKISDLNLGLLGDDAQVVVHAGKEGELTYNLSTTNKAGYFRFVENSHTLTAEFSGTVDGKYINALPLIFDNVESGKAYDINFNINRPDNMEPGEIVVGGEPGSEITVNATITIQDQTKEIDPNEPEDNILVDDMRPVNGSDDPDKDPNGDDPSSKGPEIIPYGFELGKAYHIVADTTTDENGEIQYVTPIKFTVTSETGFTEFKIVIDSTTLTPDELEGANLAANLDLINPGEFKDGLSGLGFPVENEVLNQKECNFDISGFISLLNILGPGVHKFHITVSDTSGTTKGTIWLEN